MARLPSVAVETKETQKSPIRGMGGDNTTTCKLVHDRTQGVLAQFEEAEHEVVRAGGRTAVKGEGSWHLRTNCLTDGEPMPFLVDLVALWSWLDAAAETATLGEPGTVRDTPVETVHLEIDGEKARELMWSGALPAPSAGFGGAVFMAMGGGGGKVKVPTPAITYVLDVAVNPSSRLVQEIKVKGKRKDAAGGPGGMVVVRGGGVGFGGGEEEEEGDETDAKAKKKAEDKKFTLSFTAAFKDHGKASLTIPDAARKTLGGVDAGAAAPAGK
jgi:hypothetical protein